jgi:hypothetical protein
MNPLKSPPSPKTFPKKAEMLLALGSFAYKFYSLPEGDNQKSFVEKNIVLLLDKLDVKELTLSVRRDFFP